MENLGDIFNDEGDIFSSPLFENLFNTNTEPESVSNVENNYNSHFVIRSVNEAPPIVYVASLRKGFRPNAVINSLKEKGLEVSELLYQEKKLDIYKPQGFVIDVGDEIRLPNVKKFLLDIQTKAIDSDVALYLMGEPENLDLAESIMSMNVDFIRYERPLDLKETIRNIYKNLQDWETHEKSKNILIVDDDVDYANELKKILSKKYKVHIVKSPTECVKFLGNSKPDLIIMEYMLPVCNGMQLAKMIKSDEVDFKIVFCSKMDNPNLIIELMPIGIERYILKKQPKQEIAKIIEDILK